MFSDHRRITAVFVSMSMVPRDKKPKNPSGIRLGTPLVTTRGMIEADMELLASYIDRVLTDSNSDIVKSEVRNEVRELFDRYPLN